MFVDVLCPCSCCLETTKYFLEYIYSFIYFLWPLHLCKTNCYFRCIHDSARLSSVKWVEQICLCNLLNIIFSSRTCIRTTQGDRSFPTRQMRFFTIYLAFGWTTFDLRVYKYLISLCIYFSYVFCIEIKFQKFQKFQIFYISICLLIYISCVYVIKSFRK